MIILIDGYNLLNHIFPGKKNALDKHRQVLIKQLGIYKRHKTEIKEMMLVFDGGSSTHAHRIVKEGVVIIEAGIKSSADDWIIQFAERNKGKEILLITLDRRLREAVEPFGADWLSVFDFYNLMQSVIINAMGERVASSVAGDITVYQREADDEDEVLINKQTLNLLMEQASVTIRDKIEDKNSASRRGKSYTPSKMEKQIAAKIKKLG